MLHDIDSTNAIHSLAKLLLLNILRPTMLCISIYPAWGGRGWGLLLDFIIFWIITTWNMDLIMNYLLSIGHNC